MEVHLVLKQNMPTFGTRLRPGRVFTPSPEGTEFVPAMAQFNQRLMGHETRLHTDQWQILVVAIVAIARATARPRFIAGPMVTSKLCHHSRG